MIDEAVQQLVQQTIQQMLPQIVAAVAQQLPAAAPAPVLVGGFGSPTPTTAPTPAPAPAAFGGFAATPAPTPAPAAQVTPEMVQSVIIPHINGPHGEQAKMAFGQQMQAMGIANLQDATAAQLPELYQRFQQVAAQIGASAGAAVAPSII